MILYLDTSALVKLFVDEPHSPDVRRATGTARLTVTHHIAYVEACAAFARLARARKSSALLSTLRANLDLQWEAWEILAVTETLIRRAAELAMRYDLRGYDSVHLAAAESVLESFRGRLPFCLAAFDEQLCRAAKHARIPLLGNDR